jgi:hypothetical protein
MVGTSDIVIVTVLAIGATVLLGVLGYLIDKNSGEPTERKPEKDGV